MANKTEHFMTVDNGRLQPGLAGKMMRSSKKTGAQSLLNVGTRRISLTKSDPMAK